MSGLYALLLLEDGSAAKAPSWPDWAHVTLIYVPQDQRGETQLRELIELSNRALSLLANRSVQLTQTARHSFLHEGERKQRYDVFLVPDEKTRDLLDQVHAQLKLPERTLPWHVTVASCWQEAEADRREVQWQQCLPLQAKFVAVALDC